MTDRAVVVYRARVKSSSVSLFLALLGACGSSGHGQPSESDSGGPPIFLDSGSAHDASVDRFVATVLEGGGADAKGHDAGGPVDAGADGPKSADAAEDAPADGGTADALPTIDATPPALPTVVDFDGTLLTSPKVQLIGYTEDTMLPSVEAMLTELTTTTTWATQTTEYGIGPLTILPTITIGGTPPMSLDDNGNGVTPFEQTLVTNLSGASPVWGAADASTIYTFLLPEGTNISSGGSCCSSFLGYHYQVAVGSTNVSYAVICDCTATFVAPLTELEGVTTTVSHELVEAATDPFVTTSPAYEQPDDADIIWAVATGGELADMCEDNLDSNYTPPGSTYMIQRTWSNKAATAGTNPCVPVPATGPYFDTSPLFPGLVSFDYYGDHLQTQGVTVPVGQSTTIDLYLHSDGATAGPWNVTAYDLNYFVTGAAAENTLTLSASKGSAGDVIKLTIKATSAGSVNGVTGGGFVIVSDLGGQENLSMGAVVN